ncbi:MAG: transcription elongation factor GreA [Rickettsiaceae bacterium H1]|nr:transcription elongation factor GreA [Rickettsiaceae bacterium H1]
MANTVPITKEGFAKLEQELLDLKTNERPKIIKAIAEARKHGDLSENAEYHAAKEKQGLIESKISNLEAKVVAAKIIDVSSLSGDVIKFGATITLHNVNNDETITYKLVGEYEADIENMLLPVNAPLGKALINKKVGNYVEVKTPKGETVYKILQIEFN